MARRPWNFRFFVESGEEGKQVNRSKVLAESWPSLQLSLDYSHF
jgi:hypothetical protein